MTPSKRDANESGLIELWRKLGCVTIEMDRRAGFDLIVVCPRTGVNLIEVKDGSKRWKLTDRERALCAEIQRVGVTYSIVTNETEALQLVEAV